MRKRATSLMAAVILLGAGMVVTLSPWAGAQAGGGTKVILIEIDGFEPKDLSAQTTPFLWGLVHPEELVGTGVATGGTSRNGWTWQAPRGVMSASTAASAASLLTGGYPEQTAIPADEYEEAGGRVRLGASDDEESPAAQMNASAHLDADTLFKLIEDQLGKKTAAFVGEPALFPLTGGDIDSGGPAWAPKRDDQTNPENPFFCNPPRSGLEVSNMDGPEDYPACAASDSVVMHKAATDLSAGNYKDVVFSYIHLAELGRTKRWLTDIDRLDPVQAPGPEGLLGDEDSNFRNPIDEDDQTLQNAALQNALLQTDMAVAQFYGEYAQTGANRDNWGETVVMVVGNHGYESTPITHRVVDPNNLATDLVDLVEEATEDKVTLIPQGTMATLYYKGSSDDPVERRNDINEAKKALEAVNDENTLCANAGGCIDELLYTHPDPETGSTEDTIQEKYPTWHLDHIDSKENKRTGISGDLVVTFKRGWAPGQAFPLSNFLTKLHEGESTNPYMASAGGPRNRAVAALINGPTSIVKAVKAPDSGGRYPVTKGKDETGQEGDGEPRYGDDLNAANANPVDDADDPGHEYQPETVDFAPTIGALLQVGIPQTQLPGRILQEAFNVKLALPIEDDDLGEALKDIILPAPPVPPQPPPPPGFTFKGLVSDLQANVTDAGGNPPSRARNGAKLDHIKLTGDFGRPESQVALTFYRQVPNKKRKGSKKSGRARASASSNSAGGSQEQPEILIDIAGFGYDVDTSPGASSGKAKASKSKRKSSASATRCQTLVHRPLSGGGVKRSSSRSGEPCRVETLARFAPFTLKRGNVSLKLKVPKLYKPTHIGIVVQEVKRTRSAKVSSRKAGSSGSEDSKPVKAFQGIGQKGGGILSVRDGKQLHTRKSARAKKKTRARKRSSRGRR